MKDLFANDKAVRPRDSMGRFATAERAYADREHKENIALRLRINQLVVERDKYRDELEALKKDLRTQKTLRNDNNDTANG